MFRALALGLAGVAFLLVTEAAFRTLLPVSDIPYWDFSAPVTPTPPVDTSAAAIAADGLVMLSTVAGSRGPAGRAARPCPGRRWLTSAACAGCLEMT